MSRIESSANEKRAERVADPASTASLSQSSFDTRNNAEWLGRKKEERVREREREREREGGGGGKSCGDRVHERGKVANKTREAGGKTRA